MLYIVTPVFNRKDFTCNYLQALREQIYRDFKVIIVDDGSTDGTSEMIQEQFPEVILLKEKGDLWWAEATNIGVKHAMSLGASHIMTMNDDTLPEKECIQKMMDYATVHPRTLLGSIGVHAETNAIVDGGWNINWKTAKYENVLDRIPQAERKGLHPVNVAPGRGLLIPVEVFEEVGFYDSKNFPQTVADFDLTIRATNKGFSLYCCYDAIIKMYPVASGGVELMMRKSLKNYYQHLFGMKGAGNLKWFTIFAFKNAPKKYLFTFWLLGVVRRLINYFTIKPREY